MRHRAKLAFAGERKIIMTEKFKIAWESIEGEIGSCCLHKKAAFNEISGRQVLNLSLVTSASPEIIEKMIGTRKCEKSNNKYQFRRFRI